MVTELGHSVLLGREVAHNQAVGGHSLRTLHTPGWHGNGKGTASRRFLILSPSTHTHVCTHTHTHTHTHTYVRTLTHTHTHACTHTQLHMTTCTSAVVSLLAETWGTLQHLQKTMQQTIQQPYHPHAQDTEKSPSTVVLVGGCT